jgi:hypothetical protein
MSEEWNVFGSLLLVLPDPTILAEVHLMFARYHMRQRENVRLFFNVQEDNLVLGAFDD